MSTHKSYLKSEFLRNVLTLFTGTVIAQVIPIVVSPIITRLYSPDDFGIFAAYLSFVSIFGLFATLKYELAIPLETEDRNAEVLFRIAMFVTIIMVIIYGISMMIFRNYLENLFKIPFSNYFIFTVLAGILIHGVYQVYNYWGIRDKQFLYIGQSRVIKNLAMTVFQLTTGVIQLGFSGLLIGDVFGRGIGSSILVYRKKISNSISLKKTIFYIKKYRYFPLYSSPASILNSLSIYVIPLILISLYDSEITGYYSLAQRMIGLPILLIGQSVGQVYYNKASEMVREGRSLYGLYRKAIIKLLLMAFLPTLIFLFFGKPIFEFVFGSNWVQSGLFVQIMAIPYLFRFIMNPVSQTLIILEKQNIQFFWDLSRVILIGLIFYFCKRDSLNVYTTVGLYSFGMMTMYIGQCCIIRKYIKSYESNLNK